MDPQLQEIMARLQAIEDEKAMSAQEAEFNGFQDKYAMKWGKDPNISVAVLGELNRRGIDVSAADEAVQEILDQIRAEATALLDKFKGSEQEVSDLADKINDIEQSIEAAGGAKPERGMPQEPTPEAPPPADMGMAPPADMGGAMPPMDAGMPPADMGAGAMPPEAAQPAEGGMPPEPVEPPPPGGSAAELMEMGEQLPPEAMLSDRNVKKLVLSDAQLKNIRAKMKPQPKMWKPPAHMLKGILNGK
jgi:hypothetical protein